jgi:hypothetical protein
MTDISNVEDLPSGATEQADEAADQTGLRQSHLPSEPGHNQQDWEGAGEIGPEVDEG